VVQGSPHRPRWDLAVSTAVSVALIWKVSGEQLILPVSVGTKLQSKPPVPVAVILLEQRISGTFLALPKQSTEQSEEKGTKIICFCSV
jgi:hypothetical protein